MRPQEAALFTLGGSEPDGRLNSQMARPAHVFAFGTARVPLEVQLGQADYDDPQIDRGHMVRREDPTGIPPARPARAACWPSRPIRTPSATPTPRPSTRR